MAALEFLPRYSNESVEQLLAYEGRYRTDSIVLAFEQAILAKVYRREELTDEERVVLAIEALECEVNNGGFDQFLRNSSKQFAPTIDEALDRIGCLKCARIARGAMAALGIAGPLSEDSIDQAMSRESDERDRGLDSRDAEYYANDEPIAERLLGFIAANRGSFRLP